jgi:hypothetical protein
MGCELCGQPVKSRKGRVVRFCSRACANKVTGLERIITLSERLWAKVDKSEGCWLWQGATAGEDNYGYILGEDSKTLIRAHRAAWLVTFGPIPDGLFVLHKCDTPLCVCPDHLFLGTHLENMADRDAKGRVHHGWYWRNQNNA